MVSHRFDGAWMLLSIVMFAAGGGCPSEAAAAPPAGDACFLALGVPCHDYEEAYLKASNTGAHDRFGASVALEGDTLAVGAWGEDGAARGVNGDEETDATAQSGAVYVFVRSAAGWTQAAYLKASNPDEEDHFGGSVALDGDTLAVGAWGEDSAARGVNGDAANDDAEQSGAVYVFARGSGGWSQQAYLKASNTRAGDWFGRSVALDGDTLAVGAPEEAGDARGVNGSQQGHDAENSGAVYVFVRQAARWTQQAYLKASNADPGDRFGGSLALDGDTLAVGAAFEDSAARGVDGDPANNDAGNSGAVYVFVRGAARWTQEAYLKASNTHPPRSFSDGGDRFGASVALDGGTLVVGASEEDSAARGVDGDPTNDDAAESGAVYVFVRRAAGWAQEAYLKASNTDAGDGFGVAVGLAGDTLVVGAPYESSAAGGVNGDAANDGSRGSGAAYVFARRAGTWAQQAYLKASNTTVNDTFGVTVALDGRTLVVGANEEDSAARGVNGDPTNDGAEGSGAVYVRRIAP